MVRMQPWERYFGNLNIERKEQSDFDVEELLFLVEQLREQMKIIELWARATEQNGTPIEKEEQERRQSVFEEIQYLYHYFDEVRSQDLAIFGVTFADLKKNPKFQTRARRLLEIVEGEGLMKELNKSLDALLITPEKNRESTSLVPSSYYDPRVYTKDTVVLSTAHLELDLEEQSFRMYPDNKYKQEIKNVMAFLHTLINSGMYLEDGNLNPNFSLFFLKQQNPKAWQELLIVLRSPLGKDVLMTILGKPSTWNNTVGRVARTGEEVIDLRNQEIFLRLGNPLYIALAQSIENISEAENIELYRAEKETLQEFYGELPQELDHDFEGHMLEIEIGQMLQEMNLESKEKEEKFRKIAKVFFKGKNSLRWVQKVIDIAPSDWVEFFEMLDTLRGENTQALRQVELFQASLDFLIDTLLRASEEAVGFSKQKALLDSRETKWPLLRALLSFSGSPSMREHDIELKAGKMRMDEEKINQVVYQILKFMNGFQKREPSDSQLPSVPQSPLSIRNQKYLLHALRQRETFSEREKYYYHKGCHVYTTITDLENLKTADYLTDFSGWNFDNSHFGKISKDENVEFVISGLNFQGSSFQGSKFDNVVFESVNLSNANMCSTRWRCGVDGKSGLKRVNARNANFMGSHFLGSFKEDKGTGEIEIRNSVVFEDCNFSGSSLDNTQLRNVSFKNCDLSSVNIGLDRGRFGNIIEISECEIKNMRYTPGNKDIDLELFIDPREIKIFKDIFAHSIKRDLLIIDRKYFKKYSSRGKKGLLFMA